MDLEHSAFSELKQDVLHLAQMDIDAKMLRKALIILNKTGYFHSDQQAICDSEYQEIFNLVKDVIKNNK